MINAIEVINKSPLLTDVNVTLGYQILDCCSDVSTALKATEDLIKQVNCHTGSNITACVQPVMAVVGPSFSETSIAVARQLTLKMIPQVSYKKQEHTQTQFKTLHAVLSQKNSKFWAILNLQGISLVST